MTEPHEEVRAFVERNLETDADADVPLLELRRRCRAPIPEERFRWHVEKSLPESATTEVRPENGEDTNGVPHRVFVVGVSPRWS